MASKAFLRSSKRMRCIQMWTPVLFWALMVVSAPLVAGEKDRAFGAEDAPVLLFSPLLKLSWDASDSATKFRIEINTRWDWNAEGRFALFEDFGPETHLRVGPFEPGDTVYYWRVWAGNAAGWSPPANGGPFVVLQDPNADPTQGDPLPLPQDGLWSDIKRSVKLFIQKYQSGSCLIIATKDGTDMVAFMDENYQDGVDTSNDVGGQGYTVRLLLADSSNGSLSLELPTGSITTAVSCISQKTD